MATQVVELQVVEEARRVLGLTYKQIAQAIRADESTFHRWRSGESEPSPVFLARLEAMAEFLRELNDTFRRREDAQSWLGASVPALKGKRPLDLLLEGRVETLTGVLYALNSGMTL